MAPDLELLEGSDDGCLDSEGDSYIARFGQHEEWNDLYKAADWVPHLELSPQCRRTHFDGVFRRHHCTKDSLPEGLFYDPKHVTDLVLYTLRYMIRSTMWLKFLTALKIQLGVKVKVRRFRLHRLRERDQMLNEMLQYWWDCEEKKDHDLRKAIQTMPLPMKRWRASVELVQISTPEEVKADVLWELYWLLRVQHNFAHREWHQQVLGINVKIREARERLRLGADVDRTEISWLHMKRFCLLTQRGHLPLTPRHIHFKDLLKFASTVGSCKRRGSVHHSQWSLPQSVLQVFLDSPLCTHPAWVQQRADSLTPLHPPRSWKPAVRPVHSRWIHASMGAEIDTPGDDAITTSGGAEIQAMYAELSDHHPILHPEHSGSDLASLVHPPIRHRNSLRHRPMPMVDLRSPPTGPCKPSTRREHAQTLKHNPSLPRLLHTSRLGSSTSLPGNDSSALPRCPSPPSGQYLSTPNAGFPQFQLSGQRSAPATPSALPSLGGAFKATTLWSGC